MSVIQQVSDIDKMAAIQNTPGSEKMHLWCKIGPQFLETTERFLQRCIRGPDLLPI